MPDRARIHVVGIGLDGATGLSRAVSQIVAQAKILVGSARHLSYFPDHPGDRLPLGDLTQSLAQLRDLLSDAPEPLDAIVILTSGDPLFFGLGRLLLAEFPPEQLTFHPHLSSIQLAFSRIKLPWQDARVISAHGRSLEELTQALQQGTEKLAILTDSTNSPAAIAHLLTALDLSCRYRVWVCENLGGPEERVVEVPEPIAVSIAQQPQPFAPLNVVVLHRIEPAASISLQALPLLGIPDTCFLSFSDRPGLMTKREVRVLVLGELDLQPGQVVWDIGAGTGSVSIEIARLCPGSRVYAVEKTAIGCRLIQQNCQRFQVDNVVLTQATAPQALAALPAPDRIFIGGSGGQLTAVLSACSSQLAPQGRIVLALATLEHLTAVLAWREQAKSWDYRLLQVQLSRSVPIANLTRFAPLNPVTLVMLEPHRQG